MFYKRKNNIMLLLLLIAGLCFIISISRAETVTNEKWKKDDELKSGDTIILPKIMVTAPTKTSRSRFDTPGEVNIITEEDMKQAQVRILGDVLKYETGVGTSSDPRSHNEHYFIRGFSGHRILFIVDGARIINRFGMDGSGHRFGETGNIKSMEILRGASSSLYGGNAMGGVFILHTKTPSEKLNKGKTMGINIRTGFQGINNGIFYNPNIFGIAGNIFEYSLSFVGRYNPGVYLQGSGEEILDTSPGEIYSLSPNFIFNLTKYDRLRISTELYSKKGNDTLSKNPEVDNIRENFQKRMNSTMTYKHNNPKETFLDLNVNFYYSYMIDINEKNYPGATYKKSEKKFTTFGSEIKNSSHVSFSDDFKNVFTYGMAFFRDYQISTKDILTNNQLINIPYNLYPESWTFDISGYVQDEITLWKRLIIIPGVRWDRDEVKSILHEIEKASSCISPGVGITVKVQKWLNLVGNYGHCFRAPTVGEMFMDDIHFGTTRWSPNPDLIPEKGWNAEAGFRLRFNDFLNKYGYLTFMSVCFYSKYRDFLTYEKYQIGQGIERHEEWRFVNINKVKIEGVEAEAKWYINRYWLILCNVTYIYGINLDTKNNLSNMTPPSGVIGLRLHIPETGVSTRIMCRMADSQKDPSTGEMKDGFVVFDWSLSYVSPSRFRVDVGIDNFMNEYKTSLWSDKGDSVNPKITVSYVY